MIINKKNLVVIIIGSILLIIILLILFIVGSRIHTKIIPAGNVTLETEYSKYLLGEEIKFTIKNNFNSTIYLENNCPTEPLDVFKYQDTKWVRIHDLANTKDCTKDDRNIKIPANEIRIASFAKWPKLFSTPGLYRIVANVGYYNQLPYHDFKVIAKPEIPLVNTNLNSSSPKQSTVTSPAISQPTNQVSPVISDRKSKIITINEGVVNIQYDNNVIYVLSITPASGYTYEGGQSGREVEIHFKNSSNEVKLELRVVNGQVVSNVENND